MYFFSPNLNIICFCQTIPSFLPFLNLYFLQFLADYFQSKKYLSSANIKNCNTLDTSERSLINKIKSNGPKTDPYGTPHFGFFLPLIWTNCCQLLKYFFEPLMSWTPNAIIDCDLWYRMLYLSRWRPPLCIAYSQMQMSFFFFHEFN